MRDGKSGGGVGAGLWFAPGIGVHRGAHRQRDRAGPTDLLGAFHGVFGQHRGLGEIAPPDLDQGAVPGDCHHVVLGTALDTTRADGVHPATCLVELSGPGQYQGVDSAGAERNWHVDVGILQRQRALQASLVDPCPYRNVVLTNIASARLISGG